MIPNHLVDLADGLFQLGAVKFGEFTLKLHETQPDAPKSPIYFDLRTSTNPKPGPLTPVGVAAIGQQMFECAKGKGIQYDCVAGIPHAGDPFAAAFGEAAGTNFPIITLQKEKEGAARRIGGVKVGDVKGQRVILIDDLITQAHSKVEAARSIEQSDGIVAGFIVILDREQGGVSQLEKAGYTIHSLFKISDLLDHYIRMKFINWEQRDKVMAYIRSN